jgi:hypothetical protein
MNGLSPYPQEEENGYVNVLLGSLGRPEKHPFHYQYQPRLEVGSLLLGLEHSHHPLSFHTTEMLTAMQRLGRAS